MEVVPTRPLRIIRLPEVESRVGFRKTAIYAMERAGKFPRRVQLGPNSAGWVESEVESWIADRIAASRSAPRAA